MYIHLYRLLRTFGFHTYVVFVSLLWNYEGITNTIFFMTTNLKNGWLSSCDICTIGASFEHPVIIQKIDGGIHISSAGLSIDVTARKAWDVEAEYGEVIGGEVNTRSIPSHVSEWFRDHVGNARHGEGNGGDEEDDGTHVVGGLVLDCFHHSNWLFISCIQTWPSVGCVYSCHSDWKGVHQVKTWRGRIGVRQLTCIWWGPQSLLSDFLSRVVLRITCHWSISISGIHHWHGRCS